MHLFVFQRLIPYLFKYKIIFFFLFRVEILSMPYVFLCWEQAKQRLMECSKSFWTNPTETTLRHFFLSSHSFNLNFINTFFVAVKRVSLSVRRVCENATNSSYLLVCKYLFKFNWQIMQLLVIFFTIKNLFSHFILKKEAINTNVRLVEKLTKEKTVELHFK